MNQPEAFKANITTAFQTNSTHFKNMIVRQWQECGGMDKSRMYVFLNFFQLEQLKVNFLSEILGLLILS